MKVALCLAAVASAAAVDIKKHNARVDRYTKANPQVQLSAVLNRDFERVAADVDDVLFGTLEKRDDSINLKASPLPTDTSGYGISTETLKNWKPWGGDCTCVEKLFQPCGSHSDCPQSCPFNIGNSNIPIPEDYLSPTYKKFGGIPSDSFHTNGQKQANPYPEAKLADVWTGMLCAKPGQDDKGLERFEKQFPECKGTGGCCLGKYPEGGDVCSSCKCPAEYAKGAALKAESYDGIKKEELLGEDFYAAVRGEEKPAWISASPEPGWETDTRPGSKIGNYPTNKKAPEPAAATQQQAPQAQQ